MDELARRIEMLSHSRAPRRRAAAKWLRKRGDPQACQALVAALEGELKIVRAWETQLHLTKAILACRCASDAARELLREMHTNRALKPMARAGAMHAALTLVDRGSAEEVALVELCLDSGDSGLWIGLAFALGLLKPRLTAPARARILQRVLDAHASDRIFRGHSLVYIVCAARDWDEPNFELLAQVCREIDDMEVRERLAYLLDGGECKCAESIS